MQSKNRIKACPASGTCSAISGLSAGFDCFEFRKIEEINSAAHILAALARSSRKNSICLGYVPNSLTDLVVVESVNLRTFFFK
jgi:hypothetical protein